MLVQTYGLSADEAFRYLVRRSSHVNRKHDVSVELVEDQTLSHGDGLTMDSGRC